MATRSELVGLRLLVGAGPLALYLELKRRAAGKGRVPRSGLTTYRDLADEFKIPVSTLRRHLDALKGKGVLRRIGKEGTGIYLELCIHPKQGWQEGEAKGQGGMVVLKNEQKVPCIGGEVSSTADTSRALCLLTGEQNSPRTPNGIRGSEAVDNSLEQNLENSASTPMSYGPFITDFCKGLEAAGATTVELENLRRRLLPFDDPRLSGPHVVSAAGRLLEGYRKAGGIGPDDPQRFYDARCKAAGIPPNPECPFHLVDVPRDLPNLTPLQLHELEECQESLRRQRPGNGPEFVKLVAQATSRAVAAGRIRTSITQHFFGTAQSMLRQENGS